MKKILALILCIVLMCAMPFVAFAESEVTDTEAPGSLPAEEISPETGIYIPGVGIFMPNTGEIIRETEETTPETEPETVPETTPETEPETEPETPAPTPETDAPETAPPSETKPTPPPTPDTDLNTPDPTPVEQAKTMTEQIVEWVMARLDDISVVITLLLTIFYNIRKHKTLNKSIGTLNNNAVTVAESSNTAISTALAEVKGVSAVVSGYKEEISALLAEVRANEEEKRKLQQTLEATNAHLKTAKLANVELANEVAELLVLANIPNSKKDELYSRHLAAVGAIADADKTEVKEDDGQEA